MTGPPTPERPAVLYIGGSGRSGSTLLERLLASIPGVAALGEVVHLPERALVLGQTCACGEVVESCAFWGPVGEEAFGGWRTVDGERWLAIQRAVDRNRHVPRLLRPRSTGFCADLTDHVGRLAVLYRAAAKVSGASVLVDSSKHASTAFVLRHLPDIPVSVAHIVRDSRGVAYSWTKEVARPETVDDEPMPTYSPASSAAWWDAFNLMLAALPLAGVPVTGLRYEDLLADPRGVLEHLVEPTGLDLEPGWDDFLTADGAVLETSHSIAGNPMRFVSGPVPLRRDDMWRQHLARRDRRIVTVLTAPLLAHYGYLGVRR